MQIGEGFIGEGVEAAAAWVDPNATDAEAVFANNRDATRRALAGGNGGAEVVDVVAARADPWNPFCRSR